MYRLLAVDDDPAVCRALFDYFSSRGFFVATALSAGEALRLSQTPPPFDCAVVDVLLPDQSGLKLCQAIKETGAAVVFLSALGSEDDRVQGFLSGGCWPASAPGRAPGPSGSCASAPSASASTGARWRWRAGRWS